MYFLLFLGLFSYSSFSAFTAIRKERKGDTREGEMDKNITKGKGRQREGPHFPSYLNPPHFPLLHYFLSPLATIFIKNFPEPNDVTLAVLPNLAVS